jgi:hypothetical protein
VMAGTASAPSCETLVSTAAMRERDLEDPI